MPRPQFLFFLIPFAVTVFRVFLFDSFWSAWVEVLSVDQITALERRVHLYQHDV
jgi:hypothetical protein